MEQPSIVSNSSLQKDEVPPLLGKKNHNDDELLPATTNDSEVAQNDADSDNRKPRDGGITAWLAVLGGFCGMFVSFGWINCTTSTICPNTAAYKYRYWSVPELLSDTSAKRFVTEYYCVDPVFRGVYDVPRS
jgi:hypothetical protein